MSSSWVRPWCFNSRSASLRVTCVSSHSSYVMSLTPLVCPSLDIYSVTPCKLLCRNIFYSLYCSAMISIQSFRACGAPTHIEPPGIAPRTRPPAHPPAHPRVTTIKKRSPLPPPLTITGTLRGSTSPHECIFWGPLTTCQKNSGKFSETP